MVREPNWRGGRRGGEGERGRGGRGEGKGREEVEKEMSEPHLFSIQQENIAQYIYLVD